MHKITIAITFLMLCFMQNIHAQKFKASLILGTNISQIDGDSLYGFKKLGLTTGGRLSYTNNKTFDLALEMLYSQRGSSVKLFSKQANEKIPFPRNTRSGKSERLVYRKRWLLQSQG